MCTRRRFLSNKMKKKPKKMNMNETFRAMRHIYFVFSSTIHNAMCITRITFLFAIFRFGIFSKTLVHARLWHLRTESQAAWFNWIYLYSLCCLAGCFIFFLFISMQKILLKQIILFYRWKIKMKFRNDWNAFSVVVAFNKLKAMCSFMIIVV